MPRRLKIEDCFKKLKQSGTPLPRYAQKHLVSTIRSQMKAGGSGLRESKAVVQSYLDKVNQDIKAVDVELAKPIPEPVQPVSAPAPAVEQPAQETTPQAKETAKAKPTRKLKVQLGISVSPREVQRAVKKFQKIADFRIATVQELAQDENLHGMFQTEEEWQDFVQNRLPFAEGLSHDGSGNIVIIPENLAIYDADQARAKKLGTTAGEEAMIRVMMHEGWHGAERWIQQSNDPQAVALRDRYYGILDEITESELDDLAQRRYAEFSNWRNDPDSKLLLQSEVLAEHRELAELTGEPDSLVEKFLAWLRDVLKTVTGTQAEPTPDELQELFNAWYRAQKATQTRAGPVQASMPGISAVLPQFMRDSLGAAKQMHEAGKSSQEIRSATGWFPGKYDGKMRWEIPDKNAKWTGASVEKSRFKLEELFTHNELFQAYPSLRNLEVRIVPTYSRNEGSLYFDDLSGKAHMEISGFEPDYDRKSVVLHEIQHWIQAKEGFARGSSYRENNIINLARQNYISSGDAKREYDEVYKQLSSSERKRRTLERELLKNKTPFAKMRKQLAPLEQEERALQDKLDSITSGSVPSSYAIDLYKRTAGEIEARDVQARANLTKDELIEKEPYSSENISEKDAVVLFNSRPLSIQSSIPEGIPPRPNIPVIYEDRGTGNTLDEVLDSIWPQFYTAWESRQIEAGKPLDQTQLAKEWSERISDPDYLFDKDVELRIQKKNANRNWVDFQLPPRELTAPETGPRQTKRKASKTPEPSKEDIMRRFPQMSLPEMSPEERKARLAEIADRLSYTPSVEEQEGMAPAQATKDQRKYATDGTDVELYREGVTGAEIDKLSNEAMAHAISLSPDGPSQDFGKELVKYLNGQIPTLNGLPNNQFLKAAIALNLEHSPLQRNQLGIDSQDLRKATQQILSVAGRALQAASQGRLYEPLRKMLEQAEEMTSKEAKSEIGTDDFKSISDAGNVAKVKEVKEAVDDLMPNMPVIIEASQNDADATDLFELGMEGMDPKLAKKITELNERVERLGRLRQMRARMTAGSTGPAASLPELPANMTLAELDKLIAEEEAAIKKLVDEVDKAQKKATAKPRSKKAKKVTNNATFTEYVEGKETAGLPPFVDLVKKYVQADSFNADAFSTLLANSFKEADPLFIQGVVRRISEALNGSATEEGIQDDLKKAVNYDARAKRIVATEIAQGSTDTQKEDDKPDPFVELTKQRLKGEISAKDYQEGLKKLGVEEQTAFAMLQKVDQDRARMADAEAARKVGAEARKNMEKAVKDAEREAQKHEKEALRQIESTAAQFDENTPDKPKRISELQRLKDSFLGKSGPPISEDQFIQQVQALNVKPETAQKLASWLNASRRADAMERYQKALQKAQKAKEKAIEAMVKKLDKVKNPTPQKLKKRSKFLNLVQEGMNSGILDSDLVRAAFAKAYDLHGLTPERIKDMADLMTQIESLPNSMEKETFYLRFQQLLNEIAPASSISSMAFSAYMGYVLQGAGTMIAQTSNLANFLTPLAFAHSFGQIYATTQGPPLKKMLTALSVRRNWNMAVTGMKESWGNLGLIRAGLSGVVTSTGQGLGVTPVELTATPYETSLAWTPWGQISDFRLKSNKLMENMGVLKLFKATRLPAWVASRSFQVIRGAEGWSGGVEKNMAFRRVAVAELQKQGKSYDEAWQMVDEALTGKSNKQMWDEAYAKADALIKEGTVNKAARLQKATELVQDMLDEKWNLMLENRHRQQSAMTNFKTDPLTPLGAGAYGFVARALENNHWGPFPNPLRFGFLFPRFFINSMEQAYMYSPAGLLTSIGLPSSLPDSKMKERQQRIVEIYGSLENYKQQRLGKGFTGTALLTGIGGLMAAAMQMWDGDDDEPPAFWITGDVIGRYDKRGILSETGWWAPNTMYVMGMKFNYVNASPQFGMILNAAGNIGDRYMFPELLGTKYDSRTKKHEKSFAETWVRPIGEATAAPMSRSTYRVFYDAVDNALGGDFKKLIRLITQPATGSATALTLGVIPSLKTFEKAEKSSIQPRSPQDVSQTLQAAVPFGNALGLDTGKPLYSPFGEALTPYNFFTFLSNSQEATEDSKRAAKILIDLGVSKQPPKMEYLGDGVVEIAHDGKFYMLPPEQRNDLILRMGQELARTIVREKATLQKLEKQKGRDAVSDKVGTYAAEARKKVLRGFKPEK